jgi:uncharacterized protein YecT (DUF1311 family)
MQLAPFFAKGSALLILAISTSPANAEKPNLELPDCKKPRDQFEQSFCAIKPDCQTMPTQLDMNFCAAQSARVADRKLNLAYQQLRTKYQQASGYKVNLESKLVASQQAWIQFREKNCEFSKSRFEGGSIAPLIYHSCLEKFTQQRIEELKEYLKGGG